MSDKTLYIIGGPNGAGKTTFAGKLVASTGLEYIGADKIAAELCPESPTSFQLEAGRVFLERLDAALREGRGCVVESTLSGKSLVQWILRAKLLGFTVIVQFVFLESAESSWARVKERVRKGGHDVPKEDVFRRFERTIRNFWRLYRPAADTWLIAYNEADDWRSVAIGSPLVAEVFDERLFAKFIAIAEE